MQAFACPPHPTILVINEAVPAVAIVRMEAHYGGTPFPPPLFGG